MRKVSVIVAALIAIPLTVAAQSNSCKAISTNLSAGSRGSEVIKLQQFLISQNILAGNNATGLFGKLTQSAVQKWQCKNLSLCSGSPTSNGWGGVGPKTRAAIVKACIVSQKNSTTSGTQTQNPSQQYSPPPTRGFSNTSTVSTQASAGTDSSGSTASSGSTSNTLNVQNISTTIRDNPTVMPTPTQVSANTNNNANSTQTTSTPSPYAQNAIQVNGNWYPAYDTPSGLITYVISSGSLAAYKKDGSVFWKQSTNGNNGVTGGGDINVDGYPDLVTAGFSGTGALDKSWGEIRDGKTGTLLSGLSSLQNYCTTKDETNYCAILWHVGAVLFGSGNIFAEVPQYYETGWFGGANLLTVQQIAAYYTSLGASFDTYDAAKLVGGGFDYKTPHIAESAPQNGLLLKGVDGLWRLVAFTSGRVLQYYVATLSSQQLISDTTLVTGNRPETGGRNYGLVARVGTKVILISGTDAISLWMDVRSGSRSFDLWGGLARHFAIFDTNSATVVDRFYSWAHDGGDAYQYINRVAYPSHPVVTISGTPLIFFNVFDGSRWYVSVNDTNLNEVARVNDTYIWDTIARTDGGRRFVISKTSGYWPVTPHATYVSQYGNGTFTTETTYGGIPLMTFGLKEKEISSSNGYLSYVLVSDKGVETDGSGVVTNSTQNTDTTTSTNTTSNTNQSNNKTSSQPSLSISASPAVIAGGESANVYWVCGGVSTCTITKDGVVNWSGAPGQSAFATGVLSHTTTYAISGGGVSKSVTVTVTASSVPAPTLSISASPTTVSSGGQSTITWVCQGAYSCWITKDNLAIWSGQNGTSAFLSGPLSQTASYVMHGTDSAGIEHTSAPATISVQ